MDVAAYLRRIGYSGPQKVDKESLFALQEAHLLHIPFENLDVHYGRKISLEKERIAHKVLEEKRGGFCYELNGLFYYLLEALGFEVKRVSARVHADEEFGAEYDHLAIICKLSGDDYLVDVGYGSFSLHPLLLTLGEIQADPKGTFKIEKYDADYLLVSGLKKEKWVPDYLFSLKERSFQEFEDMCEYHQRDPRSPFTQKRLCTQATSNGRITFLNESLKIKERDQRQEITIENEEDFRHKLKEYLDLDLKIK